MGSLFSPDVVIAGAGIIGLSIALELHRRGAHVTVIDRGTAMAEASTAAAGMLAVSDPDNPPALSPLAQLSATLYPGYLDQTAALSGQRVPFQTDLTLQQDGPAPALTTTQLASFLPGSDPDDIAFSAIPEHSLDPRQLAPALVAAVRSANIVIEEHTAILTKNDRCDAVEVHTSRGRRSTPYFVDCTGAWAKLGAGSAAVFPVKGQMLAIAASPGASLSVTVRTHTLYLVPRLTGPNAGRIVIGATLEEAGFSTSTDDASIADLRRNAATIFPAALTAPRLEHWAGLRPSTRDRLPILGPHPENPRHLFATAHFRNGILLAPATAHVLADLIGGRTPAISLDAFSPARLFASHHLSGRR